MKSITDYIVVLENAVPAPVCEAVLAEYAGSSEWNAALIGAGAVDRSVRHADAISISERAVIERNRSTRRRLDDQLRRCCADVLWQYNARFPTCRISRDTGFELLRYPAHGHYLEHTDSDHAIQRELACSFLLNDDFEGGQWAFFGASQVLDLKKGSAILFPANFMYPHQILPVTRGTRFALVTWFI